MCPRTISFVIRDLCAPKNHGGLQNLLGLMGKWRRELTSENFTSDTLKRGRNLIKMVAQLYRC